MQWFGGPRLGELLKSHVIVSDHSLSGPVGSDSTSFSDQRVSKSRLFPSFLLTLLRTLVPPFEIKYIYILHGSIYRSDHDFLFIHFM